jgi:hypothetical protein
MIADLGNIFKYSYTLISIGPSHLQWSFVGLRLYGAQIRPFSRKNWIVVAAGGIIYKTDVADWKQ